MSISLNPRIQNDDDSELIIQITSGRTDLFPELVRRYEQKLYNFGIRMCRDVQDAEDMVQDPFLNVFRYLKEFRFESCFKNWLYRVATRTCLKKKRKSLYAPEEELSLDDFLPGEEAGIPARVPDWAAAITTSATRRNASIRVTQLTVWSTPRRSCRESTTHHSRPSTPSSVRWSIGPCRSARAMKPSW